MPHEKYVPKHRAAPAKPVRNGVRKASLVSGVAVAATGVAVSAGVAYDQTTDTGAAIAMSAQEPNAELTATELADRVKRASRSNGDRLAGVDQSKVAALSSDSGVARTGVRDLADADPKTIARAMLGQFGFDAGQFSCLESLWTKESGWSATADNPSSSAYGIPQALPGSKMSSAGADWATNPATQIRWGLGYIRDRYGSPCSAWGHSQANNWY